MAVTHTSLMIMGVLAVLASMVLFLNVDRPTRFVLSFFGALVWALFAMSSFDVSSQAFQESQPVYPLVYIGAALAMAVGAMSFYHLAKWLGEESGATTGGGLLQ